MPDKIPLVGKPKYSIHELLRLWMQVHLAEGGDPADYSGVGGLIGRLITSGAYRATPVLYRENGVVGKSWELRRCVRTATELQRCLPEMRLPVGHIEGMDIFDRVKFTRNDRMCEVVSGLIDAYGVKAYTTKMDDGRTQTRIKDVFLMEHISEWEWHNLMELEGELSMAYYTDSRGGRNYPGSVIEKDGKLLPMISTQSGDASYLLQLGNPVPVRRDLIESMWLKPMMESSGLSSEQIHLIGSDIKAAVAFGSNPKAFGAKGIRTVGDQKRNMLEFISSCQHLVEAETTGMTRGWLSKDAHASGLVCTSIATGSSCALSVASGKKVYDSLASLIKVPDVAWIPPAIRAYLTSPEWGKAAAIPIQYTSRNLAWTFITGPASGEAMLDEDGNPLYAYEIDGAVIPRDGLNPKIASELERLGDDQIKDIAEVVNNITLAAFYRYDPTLYTITDAVLSASKLGYGDDNSGVHRYTYRNFDCVHYAVKTALDWFPADPLGRRDLPQVSITIPRKYREAFEDMGVPTRFQPRSAPFTRGEADERRRPITPWQDTGIVNRIDTPSGLLVRGTSICDSAIMLETAKSLERADPGSVVAHRHDSLWFTPCSVGHQMASGMYMTNTVNESSTHYREYISQIVGSKFLKNAPHGLEIIIPHADRLFR
jgi:hypothetical protein